MSTLQVIKLDYRGIELWRYLATVRSETRQGLLLEAPFNHPDASLPGVVLAQGDCFLEAYFWRRWYNIFQVHDRRNGSLKCWYCNVSKPAVLKENILSCRDLALDLLVYPDGQQLVLDEDEFEALKLRDEEVNQCRRALQELQRLFRDDWPFDLNVWMEKQIEDTGASQY